MASPAVITVRAVKGILVPVPKLRGNTAQYVDREINHAAFAAGEKDDDIRYPIIGGSKVFLADGLDVLNSVRAIVRHGDLEPADEMTANWCGVKFSPAPPAPKKAEKLPASASAGADKDAK